MSLSEHDCKGLTGFVVAGLPLRQLPLLPDVTRLAGHLVLSPGAAESRSGPVQLARQGC